MSKKSILRGYSQINNLYKNKILNRRARDVCI